MFVTYAILRRCLGGALGALAVSVLLARPARAQTCNPIPLTNMGAHSGERISSIAIVASPPDRMPGPAGALGALHVRTGKETIRRQLLLRVGEPLDTLRALESVHRLRRQPYLAEASLELEECSDTSGASGTLTVRVKTRDSWSTRPTVKIRSSSIATVGLEERNVLGTGRSIKTYLRSDAGRTGVGVAYTDPWVFNSAYSATLSRNFYRDGQDWRIALGTRQRSIFDEWNSELSVSRSQRMSLSAPDSLRRSAASVMFSRLWRASPTSATSVLAGVEAERTQLSVSSNAAIVGPPSVNRRFVGVDLGIARRSALYQVVDWYLPGRALTDLPLGFEGEGVVGIGRDLVARSRALHLDLWGGRIWMPRRDLFAVGDIWVSGFVNRGAWSAGSRRGTLSLFKEAARGMWTARLAGEQLTDPDPDVRALANIDPTVRALSPRSRLAESALSASLERSVHLFGLTRGYMVDGALFGALSSRRDPAAMTNGRVSLAVIGAGFRLAPTRLGRASVRLDVGVPVAASSGISRRLFIGFTLSPWIEAGRSRGASGTR